MGFTGPEEDREVYLENVIRQSTRMLNEVQVYIDSTLESARKLVPVRNELIAAITAGTADAAERAAFNKKVRQKSNEVKLAGILALLDKLSQNTLVPGGGTLVICSKSSTGVYTEIAPAAAITTLVGTIQ